MLIPRLGQRTHFRAVSVGVVCSIVSVAAVAFAADRLESLGIKAGMKRADVLAQMTKEAMIVREESTEVVSGSGPQLLGAGIREVRFHFEKDRLYKTTILFEIPEREPSAANLIKLFEQEKERLQREYGPPTQDTADMKAPSEQDRHDWLMRARAYYRTVWARNRGSKISLWLYGEDSGIVLSVIYEEP